MLRLQKVPRSLANLWKLDSQGSTWRCITSTDYVKWCVHPMGSEEPTHDVAIAAATTWKYLKASVYGTIVVKLVMEACEEALRDCSEEEKGVGWQRLWRFDRNLASAAGSYGGARKRLTQTQSATNLV